MTITDIKLHSRTEFGRSDPVTEDKVAKHIEQKDIAEFKG